MNRNNSTASFRPSRPPESHGRFHPPPNSGSFPHKPHNFPANNHRYRPVGPPGSSSPVIRPNFLVELFRDHGAVGPGLDVKALVDQCKSAPESFKVYQSGTLAGALFYQKWVDALQTLVWLWESRLDGVHRLIPKLNNGSIVPGRKELEDRLRAVFAERIRRLIDGEEVKKWNEERDRLLIEIGKVSGLLKKHNPLNAFTELTGTQKRLTDEKDLIDKRVKEFKSAMTCMLAYLEGKGLEEYGEDGIQVLRLDGGFDWRLIQSLMLRECRRLEDGLPIYAYRKEILQQIHSQQVIFWFLI